MTSASSIEAEGDEVEFEPESGSAAPNDLSDKEVRQFSGGKIKPNTFVLPLWKGGHVSFNPESSVSIFALISLFFLLVCLILVALVGAIVGNASWLDNIMTALGHAIAAVVGAIVGSSAIKKSND